MPLLDLSVCLNDPMTGDFVTVIRRRQEVSNLGRVEVVEQIIPNVFGVVDNAGPNDLNRLDDSQAAGFVLSFVTKFQLRGPAQIPPKSQWQPDVVQYQGNAFLVVTVEPYPQFGAGFTQVILSSMGSIDLPPGYDPERVNALVFTRKENSQYLGLILC